MKILIADDNGTNRKLLRVVLESEGYETTEASDGIEALEILERENVDLIISDILMPNMDGYRFCNAVRHHERLKDTPFVVYTSTYDSSGDERLAMSFGADAFLRRPAPSSELLDTVRKAADRSGPRTAARSEPPEDLDVMKIYSVQLVRQLEHKNEEIAQAHAKILAIHQALVNRTDELEQSEAKFRSIFDNILDVFYRTDMQGRIQIISPSIERYGYPPDTLIGTDIRDLYVNPGDHDQMVAALMHNQILEDAEFTLKRRKGEPFIASLSARLLTDIQRRPLEIEGILRDISERKQLEEMLRTSEAFYRSLGDAVPDFIWACDAKGKAEFVNRRFMEYTGYTLEQLTGLSVDAIHHPQDMEELVQIWKSAAREQAGYDAEVRYKRHDGEYRWFLVRAVPVKDREGKIIQWIGTSTDIHDRKQLEEKLLHSQKLEAIGRLAGGIAHDFNNLLTAVLGFAALAEVEVSPDTRAHGYLQTIQKAARRAAGLTHQLLAFARQQNIEPRVLVLNDLLLDLGKMLRPLLGEHIELAMLPGAKLWRVKVDPGQLEQVIVNLAVNARDAMPDGGSLTIETGNVTLGEQFTHVHPDVAPGDYVLLTVSDTGMGMDESLKQHIFEPFFTTKSQGKGTGLGLATCHGIVKQSGGHISLESEPGKGTTFRIYLPRVREATSRFSSPVPVLNVQGTETILLVEDEAMVREMASRALRAQGYTVLEAGSGEEALALAMNRPGEIHLLFTDVVMPQMNGRQLADRLVETRPAIKVLYASGNTDNLVMETGVTGSVDAFLQKPYTPTTLSGKVRETLNSA